MLYITYSPNSSMEDLIVKDSTLIKAVNEGGAIVQWVGLYPYIGLSRA